MHTKKPDLIHFTPCSVIDEGVRVFVVTTPKTACGKDIEDIQTSVDIRRVSCDTCKKTRIFKAIESNTN